MKNKKINCFFMLLYYIAFNILLAISKFLKVLTLNKIK